MDLTARLLDVAPGADATASTWASSGAMALTGRRDGPPLAVTAGAVDVLARLAAKVRDDSAAIGFAVDVDGVALLGERAACTGWSRAGATSVGGATRLVRARDEWLAVAMARRSDYERLPAWLGVDASDGAGDAWSSIERAVRAEPPEAVVERAIALGLACARLGEVAPHGLACARPLGSACGPVAPAVSLHGIVVLDLSSLWAGPLCGDLLARAGATVVKIESTSRPDGGRRGDHAFFDLLNGAKASVAVDIRTPAGRRQLQQLVARADVVIESSRPRALRQLGVCLADVAGAGRLRVWISITGHGRLGAAGDRVAFGDDAAVAGGLVAWEGGAPRFVADAVADPASGLVAAAATLDRLAAGGQWLVDVALSRTAAFLASAPACAVAAVAPIGEVSPPRARRAMRAAPSLGADTQAIFGAWNVE